MSRDKCSGERTHPWGALVLMVHVDEDDDDVSFSRTDCALQKSEHPLADGRRHAERQEFRADSV